MKFKPAGHRILVKMDDKELEKLKEEDGLVKKEGSSLLFIKEIEEKNNKLKEADLDTGVIVSIGDKAYYGCHDGSPWVRINDKVVFNRYAGKMIKDGDIIYRLIEDIDVLAIVEE